MLRCLPGPPCAATSAWTSGGRFLAQLAASHALGLHSDPSFPVSPLSHGIPVGTTVAVLLADFGARAAVLLPKGGSLCWLPRNLGDLELPQVRHYKLHSADDDALHSPM